MKSIFVLALALSGFLGATTARAGVAVTPTTNVFCGTNDAIMGPINIYFANARGSRTTWITVRANPSGETLRQYQGSGWLTTAGTGRVKFITVQGLPANYVLFNDGYGNLYAQFSLNGGVGATFPCFLQ